MKKTGCTLLMTLLFLIFLSGLNSDFKWDENKVYAADSPPVFAACYPKTANVTGTGLDLLIKMNRAGTAYYKVYDAGAAAPDSAELKNDGAAVQVAATSAETVIIDLYYPEGVATDRNGNVYVADTNNNRVRKYGPDGIFLYEWSSQQGNGDFNKPRGVAVDKDGNIYVADTENHYIKKYGAGGAFILQWGGNGTGDGQFNRTRGLTVDEDGYVYVVDEYNRRIQKFTADGEFITKWGSYGAGNGQFNNPTGVAVDNRNGHVYVADYWNHRIQKFTSTGQYLAKWGSLGTDHGKFSRPAGIVVDQDGNFYVAEYANHRVQKFAEDGTFLAKWGKADCTSGTGEEEFNGSNGLAMDETGNIYVTDRTNSRIQKLAYKGSDSITSGLEAGRSYDIYVVAEDNNGNLQSEPLKVDVTMEGGVKQAATPTASPAAGTVIAETQVTLSCATEGAAICYTTDGSEPTSGSTEYTTPITVNTAMIIKAIAVKDGMEDSDILTAAYTTVTGDEVYVSSSGNDDNDGFSWDTAKLTIKRGIDTVIAGGTVYIAGGTYAGENNRNITVNKNVTIRGQSKNDTIIDGGNSAQIFEIGSGRNVTIQRVTIADGTANYGAINNSGNLTINDCILKDNTATITGGGINSSGTLTVSDSSFTDNNAPGSTSGSGGAIYSTGVLTISSSNFSGNTAKYGGAIRNWQPSTFNNSTFNNNDAWYSDGCGGAIHNSSELTLNGCIFEGNRAVKGGAVYNDYERDLTVTGSTFKNNSSFFRGGAICNNGSAAVHFSWLTGNKYGNTPQDIYRGTYGGPVNAEYNWWGSNDNPAGRVSGVTVNKWLVLGVNANPTAVNTGETSIVTADLLHDQNGDNCNPANGHVPDGIPVTFNTTGPAPLGSLDPLSVAMADGQAASAFTAGASGTANITATVDDQLVSAQIVITPPQAATPTADPPAGAVAPGTQVELSCATEVASIYYTTDGSDPTTGSALYSAPVTIDTGATIKAFAVKAGMSDSDILTAAYTILDSIAPTVTSITVPAGGTYVAGQNLDFTVNFSEAVTVNTAGGTPYLRLTVGSASKNAGCLSGSGSNSIVFRYAIEPGDTGTLTVGTLEASGGALKDAAGNDANLTLNNVGDTSNILVGKNMALTAPNGGESWAAGSYQTIRWNYTGNPGQVVRIELLKNDTLDQLVSYGAYTGSDGSGSCQWTVPSEQAAGNNYKIRVTSLLDNTYTDTSANPFTITTPQASSITLSAPNSGENWAVGGSQTISWNHTGDLGDLVKIELLKSDALYKVITTNTYIGLNGSGSYRWTVPQGLAAGNDYKIRVTVNLNNTYTDTSDGAFTITGPQAPAITVSSPGGGENWEAGSSRTIIWNYSGNIGQTVKVELLKGDALDQVITYRAFIGSSGSGSYQWTIPPGLAAGDDYKIRVTCNTCTDTSDGAFTVTVPQAPAITVSSPGGGETWAAGSSRTIRWNYTGNPGYLVKIELLKNDAVSQVITYGALIGSGGSGTYQWAIPQGLAAGDDYKIRVTSVSNNTCTDTGDGMFSITGP